MGSVKEQKILEKKLAMIAIFMGFNVNKKGQFLIPKDNFPFGENDYCLWADTDKFTDENNVVVYCWALSTIDLLFSTSWAWLMPVIRRIHEHPACPSGIVIDDRQKRCYHEKGDKIYHGETTLHAAFDIVLYSIEWLNKQQ